MDIKLPYKWIKEYIKTDLDAKEFAKLLSLGGPSIERWHKNDVLNDIILDIEVTPNRPDSASVIGIAREGSAILDVPFLYKQPSPDIKVKGNSLPIKVDVEEKDLCPRYQCVVVKNVTVKESPAWLKNRLEELGLNSINNLVDITNYVLLEYGQPTHVFDYDKIEDKKIIVRKAKKGEKITTLGGDKHILDSKNLVIADSKDPIAVAGVKGGIKAEVDKSTKTVVFESANFEQYSTRKTARSLNLQTDASSLFEKGLNRYSTTPAILRLIELVKEVAGGEVDSEIQDAIDTPFKPNQIKFDTAIVERILGLKISDKEIIDTLERLGFKCETKPDFVLVTVPYFRTEDVELDYDLVEEVARIYGYHKIPSVLPEGKLPAVQSQEDLEWEDRTKEILAGIGLTEAFAYSMISEKQLEIAGVDESYPIKLSNPLTADFVYMRTELGSTLIDIAARNEDFKESLSLFELNKVYIPKGDKKLPNEVSTLGIISNDPSNETKPYYDVKGIIETLFERLGLDLEKVKFESASASQPYRPGAYAIINYDGKQIGQIGLLSQRAVSLSGIKKKTALAEINFEELFKIIKSTVKSYSPIPKYPAVTRDFAFLVDKELPWESVIDIIKEVSGDLYKTCELFDVYQGKGVTTGKKSIAFHLELQSKDKTLEEVEINKIVEDIICRIEKDFGGKMRD